MSRDYLEEASGVIFNHKVSLSRALETNPEEVARNLLRVIEEAREPMQAMIRKAAAYALGQIGEARALKRLRESYKNEPAPGVRQAMLASMTAIKLAPTPKHTQLDRCRIIEDVYHDRRPADWI